MLTIKLKPVNERSGHSLPLQIQVAYSAAVIDVKMTLKRAADVPVEEQKLIYKGKILKNEHTIEHYGIKDEDTIVFLRSSAPEPSASDNRTASAGATARNPSTPVQPQPARGVSRSRPNLGSNPDGIGSIADMMNNPELLRSMMDNPFVQNMMNNPEILRSIFNSNPQMQAILEANPQLNHVLNDPELLRQQMEAMRNPAVMQEMLRNQDRALSNIEALPGGYNALQRMYHEVQEPMMNAADAAAQRRNSQRQMDETEENESMPATPINTPIPNPWGRGDNTGPNAQQRTNGANTRSPSSIGAFNLPGLSPWFSQPGLASNQQASRGSRHNQDNPWGQSSTTQSPQNPWAGEQSNREDRSINGQTSSTAPSNPWTGSNTLDSQEATEVLQIPLIRQIMETDLSNPANVDELARNHPVFGFMLSMYPQMREALSNPRSMQERLNPDNLAYLQQLQSRLGGQYNPLGGSAEVMFSRQLSQLESMGFVDREANIQALMRSNGSVDGAIDYLVNGGNIQ